MTRYPVMATRVGMTVRAVVCVAEETSGLVSAVFRVEPRRNRTGDPILTIDARGVHDALQHLTLLDNCAGQRRSQNAWREAA